MLIVFGILLGLADWVGAKNRRLDELTVPHGIIFGLAQALALIPGVSRSGGTITGGLFLGYERARRGPLRVPARHPRGLRQRPLPARQEHQGAEPARRPDARRSRSDGVETATATVAFVVGVLVIAFFMSYISRHSFLPFVIYRIVLGGALIVLLSTGVLLPN